ncbi:MAG: NAD(P)H-dependent glycerol-3-phosphate dehydrogenase [Rhizobiaceae bacterium]
MSDHKKVTVIGGGAWGTALALTMIAAGHGAVLWAREVATVEAINQRGENPRYLPGIVLGKRLQATENIDAALKDASHVLVVVPAQTLRAVFSTVAGRIAPGVPIVICAKGIEASSGLLPSAIAAEFFPEQTIGALSGPSFARDVAQGLPTAVTVAADDAAIARELAAFLTAPHFRCYSSDDLVGVELGGALKNVMGIAAGAVSGAGLGASALAAMVTRGFVELRRVGAALGGRPETLMGLSGLGDLILTCGSERSRNFLYGRALARGENTEGLPLAEGVATAAIAAKIAAERGIEAPIISAVSALLEGRTTVAEAVTGLLARPLKSEDA